MNGSLLDINKDKILEVFDLEDCRDCTTTINLEGLKEEYDVIEGLFRRKWLPVHRLRYKGNLQQFSGQEKPLYKINLFYRYFEMAYYAICQVLGYSGDPLMPKVIMLLACDVQSETDYKTYDYP